jgi:hypothetical protein
MSWLGKSVTSREHHVSHVFGIMSRRIISILTEAKARRGTKVIEKGHKVTTEAARLR